MGLTIIVMFSATLNCVWLEKPMTVPNSSVLNDFTLAQGPKGYHGSTIIVSVKKIELYLMMI